MSFTSSSADDPILRENPEAEESIRGNKKFFFSAGLIPMVQKPYNVNWESKNKRPPGKEGILRTLKVRSG
jgi:hypothetical protein